MARSLNTETTYNSIMMGDDVFKHAPPSRDLVLYSYLECDGQVKKIHPSLWALSTSSSPSTLWISKEWPYCLRLTPSRSPTMASKVWPTGLSRFYPDIPVISSS